MTLWFVIAAQRRLTARLEDGSEDAEESLRLQERPRQLFGWTMVADRRDHRLSESVGRGSYALQRLNYSPNAGNSLDGHRSRQALATGLAAVSNGGAAELGIGTRTFRVSTDAVRAAMAGSRTGARMGATRPSKPLGT